MLAPSFDGDISISGGGGSSIAAGVGAVDRRESFSGNPHYGTQPLAEETCVLPNKDSVTIMC
jgi:hypothetical protein